MADVAFLHVLRGQHVSFQDSTYEILLSGGLGTVLCRNLETGDTALLKIEDLNLPSPVLDQAEQTSLFDDPEDLAEAKRRLLIIEPLLKEIRPHRIKYCRPMRSVPSLPLHNHALDSQVSARRKAVGTISTSVPR